jgi:hypothetical protein
LDERTDTEHLNVLISDCKEHAQKHTHTTLKYLEQNIG